MLTICFKDIVIIIIIMQSQKKQAVNHSRLSFYYIIASCLHLSQSLTLQAQNKYDSIIVGRQKTKGLVPPPISFMAIKFFFQFAQLGNERDWRFFYKQKIFADYNFHLFFFITQLTEIETYIIIHFVFDITKFQANKFLKTFQSSLGILLRVIEYFEI